MVFFLVFVANFCVDTGSSRKPKFVFSDESDTSETSSDESNDSTGDDSSDSNEDSDISKVISTPCAPVEKEYTFQELFGFEKTRAAYVDFRVCPSHVHLTWKADVKYLMGRQNVDFNKPYEQQHGPIITNVVHAVRFPIVFNPLFFEKRNRCSRFKGIFPDLTRKIGPLLLRIWSRILFAINVDLTSEGKRGRTQTDRNENVATREPLHRGGKSNLRLLLLRMTLPRIDLPKREKSSLVNFLQKDLQFPQNVNPPPVIMIVVDRRLNHLPERRENPNISLFIFYLQLIFGIFPSHISNFLRLIFF